MKIRTKSGAAAVAVAALVALGAAGAAPASAGTSPKWGCPGGAVCMYTSDGWWNDSPQHIWTSYGFHALSNEYGDRVIFNNQYATSSGRAGAYACASTSNCGGVIGMDTYQWVNITPINYVRLTANGG